MGKQCNIQRNDGRKTRNRNYRQEIGEKELYLSDKHKQQREEFIKNNPIVPLNSKQAMYMELLENKKCVLATGFCGSSKTFIPAATFADWYRMGKIKKIVVIRPAMSSSKTVGLFKGSVTEKCSVWAAPVIDVLNKRLGEAATNMAIERGDIEFVPLEVVKGRSFDEDCAVLVTEAEDCTIEECISLTTRNGGCHMVIEGDATYQSCLGKNNGLYQLLKLANENPKLQEFVGVISFDEISDIVRSKECREWVKVFTKAGYM